MIAVLISFGLVIVGLIGALVITRIDWRAFFMRRYGNDHRRGEAVFVTNGVHSYQASELWHETTFACSYWRQVVLNGQKLVYDDIVPNPPPGVPMQFDANGRRMYWPIQGGVICANKEDTGYQFTNYSPELMSADRMDRTAVKYGSSVTDEKSNNSMILIVGLIILLVVVVVGGILFFNSRSRPAVNQPPAASANTTANTTAPGVIYGVPIPQRGE